MRFTSNRARGFGKPGWAFSLGLMGILAVVFGYTLGGSRGGRPPGPPTEPIPRLTDLKLDGSTGNTVLQLRITNGTPVDWNISVRIPKPGAVPIPELYQSDQTGNAVTFRPALQPSNQGTPVQRIRLSAGQSMPLEFFGPLDPAVKEVGVFADDRTTADHLRESVNRLLKKVRIPFRLNTRPTVHLLHTAIPSDPIPVNPIMPFLLK